MLEATALTELARAVRQSRSRSTHGARVEVDDVFSKAAEIIDIATHAAEGGSIVPIGRNHTWSIVVPTAPLATDITSMAHYRFDETSGAEGADASLNDNDIAVSGATWATGKFGNCLSFDGTNDSATVTLVAEEPLRNYLYVTAWVNPSSLTGTRPICKLADRFSLYLVAGVLKVDIIDGGTTYTVSSGLTATTSTWQFITLQYLDGQVFLALDDLVYRGSIAMTSWAEEYPASGETLTVGTDGSSFFAGLLDELLIEANVRVKDDFHVVNQTANYNDVIFWPFVENAGTSIYSTRLNGETLTLTGGTWTTGKTRYGVLFDGTDDYGSCTPTAETFTGHTVSLEVGIKFTSSGVACPIITQADGLNLAIDASGNITAALGNVTNPSSVLGQLTVDTDGWYSLCVVYDGVSKQLYLNGQMIGEVASTGTFTMPAVPLYVARDGSTYGACTIDRIRVYRGKLKPYYRYMPLFAAGEHAVNSLADWITA